MIERREDRREHFQTKKRGHQGARNLHSSRRDPPPRGTIGASMEMYQVVNPDPNKKYVLAAKGDVRTGVAYFEALGYDVEPYRGRDAPHLRCVRKNAAPESVQEYMDCVLMSIDKEIAEDDEREGQRMADAMEMKIRGEVGLLEGERRLFGRNGKVAVEIRSEADPEVAETVTE